MASTAKLNLCILWEDELRQAAKLLAKALAIYHNVPENEYALAAAEAYAACAAALHGLTDDHSVAMLTSGHLKQVANA